MEKYNNESVAQPERRDHSASVHQSVNRISVLVGFMVFSAMVWDNHSVTISTLAGVTFYGLVAGMLILAPHVTQAAIAHMHEVTVRRYNELPYMVAQDAPQRMEVVDPLRLPYTRPAPPQLARTPSFVPAVDDNIQREAAAWLLTLYTEQGEPNPRKVNLSDKKERPGRVWAKSPSEGALQLLIARGIVHNLGNGIRLSVTRCPTVDLALARLTGDVPPTPAAHHPHPQGNLEVGL